MIETTATVVRAEDGFAFVRTERRSACGSCESADKGCGTAVLSSVLGGKPVLFKVHNSIGARAGEEVIIGMEEGALFRSSLITYLTPVATLLAGTVAGTTLFPGSGDLAAILGAGLGLGVGFLLLRALGKRLGRRYLPTILRRAGRGTLVSWPER